MSEVSRKPLGDVVTFQRGYDITKKEQTPGPYPVISSGGVASSHAEFRDEGPGVVIGRKGSLGGVYWSEGPYWPHDTTLWVREFKGNDPRYIYYFLQTLDLERFDAGASNPTLNRNHLHLLEVAVLPRKLQTAVADVLRMFDRLIENNRQRIEILEQMARLIYREWFVHFRFPGHEDVEFVDSDLGPIPEEWAVEITSDLITRGILEIGDGYRAKNSEFAGTEFAFVRVKNVREGYLDLTDVDYLPEPYGERVGGKRARPGDCVISMKGTVGRMAFVGERTPPLIYSPQVSYWRSLQPELISSEYLRLWMQSPVFVEQCARVKGATDMADYVNLRDQRAMRLAVPPSTVHAAFVESVSPLLSLSANLRSQIEILEKARDLLLPRLIAGELDVSDLDLDLEPVG